jgi:hypothetical protein
MGKSKYKWNAQQDESIRLVKSRLLWAEHAAGLTKYKMLTEF